MTKPLIDDKKLQKTPSFDEQYTSKQKPLIIDDKQSSFEPNPTKPIDYGIQKQDVVSRNNLASHSTKSRIKKDELLFKDDLANLDLDPIFKELCHKQNYKNDICCHICGKHFSVMKLITKKNCEFCGECICEEHGKKKRPSPFNPNDYAKICDFCDAKHIKRIVLKEFDDEIKKQDQEITKIQKQIKEEQYEFNNLQEKYDELDAKKRGNDKEYNNKMSYLTNDVKALSENSTKLGCENASLTTKISEMQQKVNYIDAELSEAQKEFEKLETEALEVNRQIEAIDEDINKVNRQMKDFENLITHNKYDNRANFINSNFGSRSVLNLKNRDIDNQSDLPNSFISNDNMISKNNQNKPKFKSGKYRTKKADDAASISTSADGKCSIF